MMDARFGYATGEALAALLRRQNRHKVCLA
jgi:hypothetical protein